MNSNYIKLYAEDFNRDIWKDYCDACGCGYGTKAITIYFGDTDVDFEE